MTTQYINTNCPLPPREAAVVEALIKDITARHPGVTGFALKGSIWDKSLQLPDADVDINWCGTADESLHDPLMGFRKVFTRDGVMIDFATWFWSDLSRPADSSFATAISLARSHVLWERPGAFTIPRRAVRRCLGDRAWVTQKLALEFADYRQSLANWADPTQRSPHGHVWDFARHVCTVWGLPILSCLLLRPPSAGRKGLMEIVDCSRRLDVPWFGQAALQAMGAEEIAPAEAQQWTDQLTQLLKQTQTLIAEGVLRPETDIGTLFYYCSGMRAMIACGCHREAVWPCWRAYHSLASLLADTPAGEEVVELTRQLGIRLGLCDDEAISAWLPVITSAIERLERESARLLDIYFSLLPKVNAVWNMQEDQPRHQEGGA